MMPTPPQNDEEMESYKELFDMQIPKKKIHDENQKNQQVRY